MEGKLRWKESFDERKASMEGKLRWKESVDERKASMKGKLRWKESFAGRKASLEGKTLGDSGKFGKFLAPTYIQKIHVFFDFLVVSRSVM